MIRMKATTAAVLSCICGSAACLCVGGFYLLNYSSWQHPQYLNTGIQLVGAGLVLLAGPVLWAVFRFLRAFWLRAHSLGLSPLQMALAEFVVGEAVHLAWHEHNQREAERLTESVMGPVERKNPWPGQ